MSEASNPAKSPTIVSLRNVYKTFKDGIAVLQNYSMTVREGQIYGLLGSSGCGKSTVLSCILGIKYWDSGTITVFGEIVKHGNIRQDIGYMPQNNALYNQLTVMEMVQFYAKLSNISQAKLKQRMETILSLLNLNGYMFNRITTLSGGQSRRVSLALTMMQNPKLLILDEPTVGLDPMLRIKIWDYLLNLTTERKTTIIITTHYIEEVKYAQIVGLMRRGTLFVEEDPNVLMTVQNTPVLENAILKMLKMEVSSSQHKPTSMSRVDIVLSEDEDMNRPVGQITTDFLHKPFGQRQRPIRKKIQEHFIRIWAYYTVIWINFLRQPVFIILILALPCIQILTTNFVLGTLPLNNPFGIVNREVMKSLKNCFHITSETCNMMSLSYMLVTQFNSSFYLKAIEFPTTESARLGVERGEITGYIEIPDNYSSSTIERAMLGKFTENTIIDGTVIKLYLDMSNAIKSFTVIKAVYGGFENFLKELSMVCNIDLRQFNIPILFRNPVYGKENTTITEYMISPLSTCLFFEVPFIIAPLILINDLDLGIFERSRLLGLKLWEIICGIFMATLIVAVMQTIACCLINNFLVGLHLPGFHTQISFWSYILACLVISFCNAAFGLMIGVLCKNTSATVLIMILVFPFLVVQTGVLQVPEAVPNPYRSIMFYIIPNVSMTKPLNWILSRAVGITHPMVWPGVLVTVGWGVTFTLLCALLLRRL